MDKSKFIELEYSYLRSEIYKIRSRLVNLAVGSVIFLPAAQSAVTKLDLDLLLIALPIFIVAVSFLYIAESRAIMRLGSYIKNVIEKQYVDEDGKNIGWENWLSELNGKRRIVDKILHYYFCFVLSLYYMGSCYIAIYYVYFRNQNYILATLNIIVLCVVVFVYLTLFILQIFIWNTYSRNAIDTLD